jgi:hypothetical protein
VQHDVVVQHAVVEQLQVGIGFDGVPIVELVAQRGVGGERFHAPPAAVQREHVQAAEALPQRVLRHQRPQLGQQLAVVARLQIEVDAAFQGEQAELFELLAQPPCLDPALCAGVDVGQDGAAPQAQRLPQLPVVAAGQALVHGPSEAADIDLVVVDGKGVGARHGGDDILAHRANRTGGLARR